jgi:aromatic-L-amino-acid/L-tryptophan decarboxylase
LRDHPQLVVYVSRETHTWIQKAADLFGLGTKAIRWIDVDENRLMRIDELARQVEKDRRDGLIPIMVVGTAGTVSFGAVDQLPRIAEFCAQQGLWFHVDGAYGAPAAALPEASPDLQGLRLADSVALDPHKWLYSPLEAGCLLIKDAQHLINAFSFHPEYYHFRDENADQMFNYFEFGMQNSRGFRALKVWLALRQVGRVGYIQMIRDDIAAAKALHDLSVAHPELEAFSTNLSITTFRFVPLNIPRAGGETEKYLSELNRAILNELEAGGEIFISNAVLNERFLLRACVVNFRTAIADMKTVVDVVVRVGQEQDAKLRPKSLKSAG